MNRETKRERFREIPENLPWKKTYKKTNCRDAQSRNQKGEWKALGQNQLQRYPSQGIRKMNGNALGQNQLKRYPVKGSER
jgi:hypothetical protein